ncbi:Ig-like domain-containing protein [Pseudomonas stutzeri]|nr:Ig-like domain-containing protein [Stutzerimonas stutzeri]
MNDAPVAQNDAVTVSEDVPFSSSISLLANDSDVDGDSLSVVAGILFPRVALRVRGGVVVRAAVVAVVFPVVVAVEFRRRVVVVAAVGGR